MGPIYPKNPKNPRKFLGTYVETYVETYVVPAFSVTLAQLPSFSTFNTDTYPTQSAASKASFINCTASKNLLSSEAFLACTTGVCQFHTKMTKVEPNKHGEYDTMDMMMKQ